MATPGTEMLRGSMHLPVDDLHNAVGRTVTVMDRAEHFLHKAILGGSVMGAATYAAQMHLQSLGRSDRDEFLKKRLSMGALASAAVSRGAFSSILPMVADLGTYALGMDPLFDTRVSGGAAQGVLSSPVVGLGNTAFDAMHGIFASARGDGAFNQRDARAIQGLLPFSNFLPVVWATNAMIGGLPNRDTHKHWN